MSSTDKSMNAMIAFMRSIRKRITAMRVAIDEELQLLTHLYGDYLKIRFCSTIGDDDTVLPWEQIVCKRIALAVPVIDIFESLIAEMELDITVDRIGISDEDDMQDIEIRCTSDNSTKADALLKSAITIYTES